MAAAISTKALTKTYGDATAVDSIDLEVHKDGRTSVGMLAESDYGRFGDD